MMMIEDDHDDDDDDDDDAFAPVHWSQNAVHLSHTHTPFPYIYGGTNHVLTELISTYKNEDS